ncbi:unknown [Clostridium sp. CAG:492]|nr:unknown [Clostridium sp. CAG:492]
MLEEYEKSEIVNDVYMRRIMEIIDNSESEKVVIGESGQCIVQLSDGKRSVNIYKKDNCYVINLDGTNFMSIIAAKDDSYMYKNKKLGIDYKLSQTCLDDMMYEDLTKPFFVKKVCCKQVKDFSEIEAYVTDERGKYILVYIKSTDDEGAITTVYDKLLVEMNDQELVKFLNKSIDKEDESTESYNDEDELPNDVEDFDFSKYEEESDREEQNEESQPYNLDNSEEIYKEVYKYNRDNLVFEINGDEISDNDEQIVAYLLQDAYKKISDCDEDSSKLSYVIDRIIRSYEVCIDEFYIEDENVEELENGLNVGSKQVPNEQGDQKPEKSESEQE